MPDLYDRAQQRDLENQQLAQDTHAARRVPEPEQLVVDGVVYCIDCDETVESRRLEAKPNAARCIACQTIWEKQHGR